MPFALVTIGLILIVTGVKDTYKQLGAQIVTDFTGSGNFIYWVVSIFIIGALGYIPAFEKFSRWLLALVIVVLVLNNRGFFAQFTSALQSGTATAPPTAGGTGGSPNVGSTGGGSGSISPNLGTDLGPIIDNLTSDFGL